MAAALTEHDIASAQLRAMQRRKAEAENQLEQREYLRHEIAARTHVRDLETIALVLFSGKEAIACPVTEQITMVPLDKDRTKQLDAAAKVKLALLKKVLPDIKHMELTGAGGEDLGTDRVMAELELRNRLRAVLTGNSLPAVVEHLQQPEAQGSYDFLE